MREVEPVVKNGSRTRTNDLSIDQAERSVALPAQLVVVFLVTFCLLFGGMSLRPGLYDEGIVLTGAMRVAAGQIPHRDFYFIYGPAEIYLLAGLFKLFGSSLLVERLFDLSIKAMVVTSVYSTLSLYCRRSLVVFISILAGMWIFSLNEFGLAITPVSLLNIVSSAVLLPVFAGRVSTRRMLTAGAISGATLLFRYDTGTALLGVHACAILIAICLRYKGAATRLRNFASAFWPYLAGFGLVTVPPALYYLSVAPIFPLFHDVVLFPSKYYHSGRNLPFPRVYLIGLENLELYLPVVVMSVSLCILAFPNFSARRNGPSTTQDNPPERQWRGFLVTFGLILAAMYLKGLVRVGLVQMYLAIIPSLLVIAVLYEHRSAFSRPLGICISCFLWISLVSATWASLHEIKLQYKEHSSLAQRILSVTRNRSPEIQTTWCKGKNPLTKGLCFLPEDDRIRAIEFVGSHTRPGQSLYSGQGHHDRIFANDNLIYFATQRMPATHWSHFDPDLQNRYDIQTQMVHELKANAPPYIVLDSEFDSLREPNDSANSSGALLLDNYIHDRYELIETFGIMSIWKERSP